MAPTEKTALKENLVNGASTPVALFPVKFEDVKLDGLPAEPNLEFSFVVKAPKKYVWDSWHLAKENGGNITLVTTGDTDPKESWPMVANNMERTVTDGPLKIREIMGNVKTPEDGDWHTEWKTGMPYARPPCPVRTCLFTATHGRATLVDGPGPDETTVNISNYHAVALCLPCTKMLVKTAIPTWTAKAPARFAAGTFVGPQVMSR